LARATTEHNPTRARAVALVELSFPVEELQVGGSNVTKVSIDKANTYSAMITLRRSVPVAKMPPHASFTYAPASPKNGEEISFYDQSYDYDDDIVSWRWEFGDGTASNATRATHAYLIPGTYSVFLTVTDQSGNTDVMTLSVVVGVSTTLILMIAATVGVAVLLAVVIWKRRKSRAPPLSHQTTLTP